MEKLFNIIFLGGLVSLFSSRLFYGIFHAVNILSNPFLFLLIPYFPGLSLLGGVVGIGAFFLFLATRKKNLLPLGRMLDFFSIAFLISLPVGFIGFLMFAADNTAFIKVGSLAAGYFVLFIIFLRFLLPRLLNGKLKEGTIAFIFLICFSIVSLISNAFPQISLLNYSTNFQNLILITILIASAFFLIKQEDLLKKIKKLRGKS